MKEGQPAARTLGWIVRLVLWSLPFGLEASRTTRQGRLARAAGRGMTECVPSPVTGTRGGGLGTYLTYLT